VVAGRYEVHSRLGAGGMAEVMLARDRVLGRMVALKLLAPGLADDPEFVERFRREATAVASLNHANVVVVYDRGVADGQPFIAMEYVAGRTLKQVIAESAPLAPEIAAEYARQVLGGLSAAHAAGIVHRDVKPQNIIVREDGTLKVADFGVARSADQTMLTQHGSVIGTAAYISPEQARGEAAFAASDLYSVGVVLFEMLTGTLPFTGEAPLAIANQHVASPPPPVREVNAAIPARLARVVDRALSKEPAGRYSSAREMMAALTVASADDPSATLIAPTAVMPQSRPAPPAGAGPPPGLPTRGRATLFTPRRVFVALLAGLGLAIGLLLVMQSSGGPRLVPIPSLIGTPVTRAKPALEELGFNVRIGAARHSGVPSGNVAAIRPATPTAAFGTVVTITPSSGPLRITIPPVGGLTKEDAISKLTALGLEVQLGTAYAAAPAGTALGTTPPQGTTTPAHSSILLSISAGQPLAEPAPLPPGHAKGPGKGHAAKGNGHKEPGGGKKPKASGMKAR
jgi:hypothetical protein